MKAYKLEFTILLKFYLRILIVLTCLTLTRTFFYLCNLSQFQDISFTDLVLIHLDGIRYDLLVITFLNLPFLAISIFHFLIGKEVISKHVEQPIFYLFNIPPIALNIVDAFYYPYSLTRSTTSTFKLLLSEKNWQYMLGSYLVEIWYGLLLLALLVWFMVKAYKKTKALNFLAVVKANYFVVFIVKVIVFFSTAVLFLIFSRGGFQLRPLQIVHANRLVPAEYSTLVLNSMFTVLKTLTDHTNSPTYFDQNRLRKIINPIKNYSRENEFQARNSNVVILIVESLSKEYMGGRQVGKLSYTPFLDSLMQQSAVFTNAYSNGRKSIDAVPAILAGIPTFIETPFINSMYVENKFDGLGDILSRIGYSTAFFHGGINGTMDFDSFVKSVGIKDYHGKNEFGDDAHFDGHWGIFDEDFLHYTATEINKLKQPFLSCVFTLSSHHPYKVPDKYESRFHEGSLKIHKTISYADFSLRTFFDTISQMEWFSNTLFVITADHSSISENDFFKETIGEYSIPLFFFNPKHLSPRKNAKTVQHIDIMPSVLNFLHYDQPFFSLGQSVFSNSPPFYSVNFQQGYFHFIQDSIILKFDGNRVVEINCFNAEIETCNTCEIEKLNEDNMIDLLKATVQTYHEHYILNQRLLD